MSDQVIRYASEQQFLDYRNQRSTMTGGKVMEFPDWNSDPDDYWKFYYDYKHAHPGCVLEWRTFLIKEQIEKGVLQHQYIKCDTLMFETIDEYRTNKTYLDEKCVPDPGTPVSAVFKTLQEAENMRNMLLKGESEYYYDIEHKTRVVMVTREKTV